MARYAFYFKIKPELRSEYQKAHDEIWPDMAQAIRKSGIRNYSIYFRPDGTLFACFEARDPAGALDKLSKTEVNGRWQKAMDRFFVKRDPTMLGPDVQSIEEVFHID